MNLKEIKLSKLVPNEWNPNEMDDETFDRLAQSIDEDGFNSPLQVVSISGGKYRIIGGEHRYHAAKANGMEKIFCVVLPKKFDDVDEQKFLTVKLNAIAGKLNSKKMADLYISVANDENRERLKDLFGFTKKDKWEKLVADIAKTLEDSSAIPEKKKAETKKKLKKVKTIDGLNALLREILSDNEDNISSNVIFFTHKSRVVYNIIMNERLLKLMSKMVDNAVSSGLDINDVLSDVIERGTE